MSLVSIILPTYNRASFLPLAFESIRSQTFTGWELLIIDDGSSDDSSEIVAMFAASMQQSVRYIYQDNQGAYSARNTGLGVAKGAYLAFFDSDDEWLPHHLADCVSALEANPDVDWVYGAGRRIDHESGQVLTPKSFFIGDIPRAFLNLRVRRAGKLRIIEDPRVTEVAILHGLYCGMQNSVIRASVFAERRFRTGFRNAAEDSYSPSDQVMVIHALAAGHIFAYFDNVHVVYRVHRGNSSGSASGIPIERYLEIIRALSRGFEEIRKEIPMSAAQAHALNRRLGEVYFWAEGYALLWQNGRYQEAFSAFKKGIEKDPFNLGFWKTYLCRSVAYYLSDKSRRALEFATKWCVWQEN